MSGKTMDGRETKYGEYVDSSGFPTVHRSTDEFPAGDECELTVDDLPDDENKFYFTNHYENESRERTNPDVTQDVIDQLINDSAVRRAPEFEDRYLLQKEIDSYEWTMVVADDGRNESPRFAIVTIYSNFHGSVGTTNRYLQRRNRRKNNAE